MREYLGVRWAWDPQLRRNVAYCTFCWQDGRERPVEVADGDEGRVVVLTCTDPGHGQAGLRLVRDSGGFRWGEVELDCRRSGSDPGSERGPRGANGAVDAAAELGGLGLPPATTP